MLKAGAAQFDVSPIRPMFLFGYPHVPRQSTGVHDPLRAAALCLDNDGAAILVIAVDILFVSKDSAARCRADLYAKTGILPSHILISATHTHSGPVTADYLVFRSDPIVPKTDPVFLAYFESQIVEAGVTAWKNRVPAELAATSVLVDGVGGNRLSKTGLADREAGVLIVRHARTHAPIAINIVYSMHPTVLHEDTTLASADFPGFAKKRLIDTFPGAVALYHTGPSGNQSPRYSVTAQTFSEADRLGGLLATPIIAGIQGLTDSDFENNPKLASAVGGVTLQPRTFMSPKAARKNLVAKVALFERLKREGAGHGPVRTAECTVFGAEELVVLADAQESGELRDWQTRCARAEIQVLQIGPVCLTGLPGELFVEYGLEIKRQVPLKTWVVSLANGELQGYIVTPDAEKEGGYEAQCGFFKASNGILLVDEAVRLIRTLA